MTKWIKRMTWSAVAWAAMAGGPASASAKGPCSAPAAMRGGRPPAPGATGPAARHQQQHGRPDRPGQEPALDGRQRVRGARGAWAARRAAGRPLRIRQRPAGGERRVRPAGPALHDRPRPRVRGAVRASPPTAAQEYCGTVIQDALDQLPWSPSPRDLKVVFIAGNEPFSQGPVDFRKVTARGPRPGHRRQHDPLRRRARSASRPAGARARGWPTAPTASSTRTAPSRTSRPRRTTTSRGWAWS